MIPIPIMPLIHRLKRILLKMAGETPEADEPGEELEGTQSSDSEVTLPITEPESADTDTQGPVQE